MYDVEGIKYPRKVLEIAGEASDHTAQDYLPSSAPANLVSNSATYTPPVEGHPIVTYLSRIVGGHHIMTYLALTAQHQNNQWTEFEN